MAQNTNQKMMRAGQLKSTSQSIHKIIHPAVFLFLAGLLAVIAGFFVNHPPASGLPGLAEPLRMPPDERPALPERMTAFNRTFELKGLKNPIGAGAKKGGVVYRRNIALGRELYFKNCVFCHGGAMDGNGPQANVLARPPADLRDPESVMGLSDAYLFWRITKGAADQENHPLLSGSAMPAWENRLSEKEIWQAVLFLRDAVAKTNSGNQGRQAGQASAREIYTRHCAPCHGKDGDGFGPAADRFNPRPRDFTIAEFKFRSSPISVDLPSDQDIIRVIRDGLPGTAMPGWKDVLNEQQILGLVDIIKGFGEWRDTSVESAPPAPRRPGGRALLATGRGRTLFDKVCETCHGRLGRGDVSNNKKLKDNWGYRIWPRNLWRRDSFRWVRSREGLFHLISIGIPGTPMPEHASTVSVGDRWAIVDYVYSLSRQTRKPAPGRTVIRGVRLDGDLPTDPFHPDWNRAPVQAIRLMPNFFAAAPLYHILNDIIEVRVLHNGNRLAIRIDVDDHTFSVPGDFRERRHAQKNIPPTPDAMAIRYVPSLRDGQILPHIWAPDLASGPAISAWYWRAPSRKPKSPERVSILDWRNLEPVAGTNAKAEGLSAKGVWRDGQWRLIFTRALRTDGAKGVQFAPNRYIPLSFANWDGWAGHGKTRHGLSDWHWILLEKDVL